MKKTMVEEKGTVIGGDIDVPVNPSDRQYSEYNITSPKSFSIYNDEGSALYRGEVEKIANQLRAELFGLEAPEGTMENVSSTKKSAANRKKKNKTQKAVAPKVYSKRRLLFLILPMVLALIIIAAAVIGVFGLEKVNGYISIYNYKSSDVSTGIVLLDPVFSFLNTKLGVALEGVPASFGSLFTVGEETASVMASYVLPIAIVIYVVFALAMFIASLVGVCSKKKNGSYVKIKLGFVSLLMLLCALLIAVSGLILAGETMSGILGFISGTANFAAGYVLYAMVVVPVLTFICSCCAYRRQK